MNNITCQASPHQAILENIFRFTSSNLGEIYSQDYRPKGHKTKNSILVVEHNEKERNLFLYHLMQFNYEVSGVASGKEALEKLGYQHYDLVLTENIMPEMSGSDLLQIMKAVAPRIEVIIVTAYVEIESYFRAMSLGAFEYLNKPIKTHELKRIIARVFSTIEEAQLSPPK
jgi:two-component system response regulator AtoC